MTIHLPLCSPINVENVRCAVRLLIASSALIIRPTAYLRTVQSIAGNSTSLSSVRISFTHLISVLHDSRQFPEQYGLYISYFIVSEVMLTELSWDSAPVTLTMPVLRAREASLDEDTHFYSRKVLYLGLAPRPGGSHTRTVQCIVLYDWMSHMYVLACYRFLRLFVFVMHSNVYIALSIECYLLPEAYD